MCTERREEIERKREEKAGEERERDISGEGKYVNKKCNVHC